ncbi:MAG: hypothetical protein K2Y33_09315 [Mycolicibacterium frederiksbergense]|nr:hypothetical protein [Mycolicibacterium frederiksbergense]
MTLVYPDFYEGFRWDVELLVSDIFSFAGNRAALIEGVEVVPWFPPNDKRDAWLSDGNAFLWVHRLGGPLNTASLPGTDQAVVQMAGLTKSRAETNEFMSYVAAVLNAYGRDGGHVQRSSPHLSGSSTTFIRVPGEVVGPQLIPERFRDERLIPAQWEIHVDLPKELPDYREALDLEW